MLPMILAVVLSQTPIADQIRELRPDLPETRIETLADAVNAAALYTGQDPALLMGIMRVETNFEADVRACWPAPWKGRNAVTCDYGVAQINQQWIKRWHLDADRLQHDDFYNLMVAAKILADIEHRFGHREPQWFTRFHSGTPSLRMNYAARLFRFVPMGALVSR